MGYPIKMHSLELDGSVPLAYTLLLMLVTAAATERAGLPHKPIAIAVGLLVILFVLTETHLAVREIAQLVSQSGRALLSPAGISTFVVGLEKVAETRFPQIVILIVTLYLTLQAFCIPGTIVLNAAIGALLGTTVGVPLAVGLGAIGATLCYTLSAAVGSRLVDAVDHRLMKGKGVARLRAQVQRYKSDLLVYLLFLRLTPVLPNWLINLASPVVHVPLRTFALGTLLGIIPQTYLSVRFGSLVVDARRRYGDGGSVGAAQSSASPGASPSPTEPLPSTSIVTTTDTIFMCCLAVIILVIGRLRKRFVTVE